MQALTLWAPQLLNALRVKEAQQTLQDLKLPALQTLLAKADAFPAKQLSFYENASYLFHQPSQLPIAATLAKKLLPEFDQQGFWLKVDPVQMIPDRDSLVLIAGKHLAITVSESKALLEAFNDHFKDDGVELFWGNELSWFLSIKQPIDINTTLLDKVDHQPVNAYLPSGNASQYWRQLMNETQMLFFNHPINEQRRNDGHPEINSVWVWGEGKLSSEQIKPRNNAAICSQQAYLQGISELTCALTMNKAGACNSFKQFWSSSTKNHLSELGIDSYLVMLDEVFVNIDNLTIEEWQALLIKLEKEWFEPLLEVLSEGKIASLLIDVGSQHRYHLKPSHKNRFWRFKKNLAKI